MGIKARLNTVGRKGTKNKPIMCRVETSQQELDARKLGMNTRTTVT